MTRRDRTEYLLRDLEDGLGRFWDLFAMAAGAE